MPFLPHTSADLTAMLAVIGVERVESLFDEIPADLLLAEPPDLPEALNEMQVMRLYRERAAQDEGMACFIGAGAYEHHIPAAVWQLLSRGEFYTAYTPYQPEASQGTLQALYEFQTMMAGLLAMEVANASLYDGASALAEAVLMAVRCHGSRRRVLLPATLHPRYRQVVHTLTRHQGIELVEVPYCTGAGRTLVESLAVHAGEVAALVIPQPNFFGMLEEVDPLTEWAHAHGALVVGVVNPVALGLLKPPGQWGADGADIACGEGQPLGAPLAGGGPYFGFIATRMRLVRQLPGRIAGRTLDREGREGFVLTLQAREQHIRRAKATSNICTNQGLLTVAAAVHLSLLGPEGLRRTAAACHANLLNLLDILGHLPGVEPLFDGPRFHEAPLRLPAPVEWVVEGLAEHGFAGGYPLHRDYPELGDSLLVCVTETKEVGDLALYATALAEVLEELGC